jgi:hypothetical protein
LDIGQDLICRNSQSSDALCREPNVSPFISLGLFTQIMAPAVDLDGKARRRTVEIEDVGTERMLATEPRSRELFA